MKTAVNFSPQAGQLKRQGEIDVDFFKSHTSIDWLEQALEFGPAYVHIPLDAGSPDLAHEDWPFYDSLIDRTSTKWINIHLSASSKTFAEENRHLIGDRWAASLDLLSRKYGRERVIAENVVYRKADAVWMKTGADPSLISEVIKGAGVGLLLDSAHARLSSMGFDCTFENYVSRLPLESLRDWHVTGTTELDGKWRDSMAMTAEDWQATEHVAELIRQGKAGRPEMVTLEYGGLGDAFAWRSDPEEIKRSLARLRDLAGIL